MKVTNLANGKTVAEKVSVAKSFLKRAKGLLFSPPLKENRGLWIEPCNAVHTFFMSYDIDVIFLSENCEVLHIIESMKPWKISKIVPESKAVLELPAGTAKRIPINIGDRFRLLSEDEQTN
ncbi:MAG TPA: DUF192 domain-containing protein [Peptococcaceae bacterium]|nr:MAG: hypothetical protein XD50_1281 [Clostridia bacterium 41_269]HBT20657.1 DUF192 domain-containing protein [Peptococcaceae bacterium]